jgi:membrane protein YqaA with SNARE-associated domain
MLHRLYTRTMLLAEHRHAPAWLFGVAVAEASFFPVPVEAILLPMMFAKPKRGWWYSAIATAGTVVGGALGFAIGALLYNTVGQAILDFYGQGDAFQHFSELYRHWGGWIVFAGGFTPIPYKVISIASGVVRMDIWLFLAVSLVSRGMRFYIQAALLWWFGPAIRHFVEKNLVWVAFGAFMLAVIGFALIKWLGG